MHKAGGGWAGRGKELLLIPLSSLQMPLNARPVYIPEATPSDFQKSEKKQKENPEQSASCLPSKQAQTKVVALQLSFCLPPGRTVVICSGAGSQNSQERLVFVFLLFFFKPNQDFDFQK